MFSIESLVTLSFGIFANNQLRTFLLSKDVLVNEN